MSNRPISQPFIVNRSSDMRLFIAIELLDEVKTALLAVQEQLRRAAPPVKWVAPAAMHLTLVFLGKTDTAQVPIVVAALRAALVGIAPLRLQLGAPSAFPNARSPSILWVGVEGDTAALEHVQATIAATFEPLGFPREQRPFRAHLTLGRVRRDAQPTEQDRLGSALAALPTPPRLVWYASQIVLFQSELLREEPRYTALQAIDLRARS